VKAWLLDGKSTQATPTHALASSPAIRKDLVDQLQVRRVESQRVRRYEGLRPPSAQAICSARAGMFSPRAGQRCVIQQRRFRTEISLPRLTKVGSRIVTIKEDFARQVNARAYPARSLEMAGANSKFLSTGH
jgi:hypothetical protein